MRGVTLTLTLTLTLTEDEDEAGAIAERGDAWGGGAAACTGARGVARGSHDSRVGAQ